MNAADQLKPWRGAHQGCTVALFIMAAAVIATLAGLDMWAALEGQFPCAR